MKKLTVVLFILILVCFFSMPACAEEIYDHAVEEFNIDELEEKLSSEEKEISGKLSIDGNYNVGAALARLWKDFVRKIVLEFKANFEICTILIALSLLCTMGSTISDNKNISAFIEILGCGTSSTILLGNLDSIIGQTVDAMYRLSDYSKAALPVVFTAAAAGGAVGSAASKFAAVSLALDVLMSLSQKIIVPTVYAFLALSISNSLFPNSILSGMNKLCKWAATTMMTAMTITFTTYISMIGAIGTAVDAAAVKTARSFISGALPVVGGMISDASAMVLSAAGVIRNSTGVFGLITVCIMCAGPFAVLSVKMLLLKAVSSVAGSMQNDRLSMIISAVGTTMSLLLGLLGSCGMMLFISLTAGMKAVSV